MPHRLALRARADQHFAYSGRSVLVVDLAGRVTGQGSEGFYVENTRLLSRHELTVDRRPLEPVAASPVGGSALLAYAQAPEGPTVPRRAVAFEMASFVGEGLREVLRIENYSARETARFALGIHLAADFADIEEAQQGRRQQTADVETCWDAARQELRFRYTHPCLDWAVVIRIEQAPAPVRHEDGALVVGLELAPHVPAELRLVVEPVFRGRRLPPPRASFRDGGTSLDRVRRDLRAEIPTLTTTNATVARAWETATLDLASLPLGLDAGPAAPSAGLPLYQQFFGRDMLTIGWQAVLAMPTMLRDALRLNAAWQGRVVDDWRDEEPGKMIHQARQGPLSLLGLNPFERYYGDWATVPDFLIMVGQYLLWTGDLATVRELLPAARQGIDWLERYGDLDRDGFIEYYQRSPKGVKNQGWKDSDEAIVDEHGEIVPNPIATSELQAYWYAGLQQAGLAFVLAGDAGYGLELLGKARALKQRFERAYWLPEEGFYAMALGPGGRPVRSIASNAAHLLGAGMVPLARAQRVVERLMEPDLFSGWGIRTLSSDHPAYNPFSYHLGSVWPVENGTFALGFARYGCWGALHQLAEGLFAATDLFVGNRLPEAIGGLPRDEQHPHPGIYPDSCEPQGWSASMIVMLVQALLGLHPLAPLGLLLVDPHLPPWLPDLKVAGIRVGEARLDLKCWRTPTGATRYRVARREGRVRVLRQPPPEAADGSLPRRLLTALTSLPRG